MQLRLITGLRIWGRPVVTLAAALIVVQAFLTGLAGAQASLFQASGLVGEVAVICHGHGGAGSDHGSIPDPGKDQHPCCVACTASAPPAVLPVPAVALRTETGLSLGSPILHAVTTAIAARAVRAGLSQAPPSLA